MKAYTNSTIEEWKGEYPPEVGNMASVGNIRREAEYGVVVEVAWDKQQVVVVWYAKPAAKKSRKQHARPENKNNQAARRCGMNVMMAEINKVYEGA